MWILELSYALPVYKAMLQKSFGVNGKILKNYVGKRKIRKEKSLKICKR